MEKFKHLLKQILMFTWVGILCFAIDFGILHLLTGGFHLNVYFSTAVSFTVSVVVNYFLSLRFVFHAAEGKSKVKQFWLFIILSVIGLILTELIMKFCISVLCIHYLISKVIATLLVMIFNFVTRKLLLEK